MGAHDSPRGEKTTKVRGFGLIFLELKSMSPVGEDHR